MIDCQSADRITIGTRIHHRFWIGVDEDTGSAHLAQRTASVDSAPVELNRRAETSESINTLAKYSTIFKNDSRQARKYKT